MTYTPTLFTKDGDTRTAYTISDYVRFVFDGWIREGDAEPPNAPQPSVKKVNGHNGPIVDLSIDDIPGLRDALASSGLDQAAVTAIVQGLLSGAPAAYDTLIEIANAMAADDTAATTLLALVNSKIALSDVPNSTTSVKGLVELATDAETTTGTDGTRAATPSGVAAALAAFGVGSTPPNASTTTYGTVRYATSAEVTTGTATDRVINPARLTEALAALARPGVSPESYGAIGDGVTDDGPALRAAAAAQRAKGGGKIILTDGKIYGFTGNVPATNGVFLTGNATRQNLAASATPSVPGLRALSANAQVTVGTWAADAAPGGVQNVYVDGNFIGGATPAKKGLVRVAGVDAYVSGLFVTRSAGDGLVFDGLQNSTVVGGMSTMHVGSAVVMDNGAGAISFLGGYYGTSKGGLLTHRDTAGEANLYPFGPTQNTWTGTIFEAYAGQASPLDEPFDHIIHISGTQNYFDNCNFTGGANNSAAATVLIDNSALPIIPTSATFNNCTYWVHQGHDAIRVTSNAWLVFTGLQSVQDDGTHHATSFICADGASPHVAMLGEINMNGDVNGNLHYRAINGGTLSQFYHWKDGGTNNRLRSGQVWSVRREGDTGHRMYVDRDGTIAWFHGVASGSDAYIRPAGGTGNPGLEYYSAAGGTHNFKGADVHVDGDVYVNGSLTPLGSGGATADFTRLSQLERQTRQKIDTCNRRVIARTQDAQVITELWNDTAAWVGTATVAGGKMYNAAGAMNRDISAFGGVGQRFIARGVVTIPVSSARYAYFGVCNDTAGGAVTGGGQNAFMIGMSNGNYGVLKGANVSGSVSNTPVGTPGAGDYIVTIVVDEENISLSLAPKTNPGQTVASTSILRSQMPGGTGAINNIIISNSDTTNAHAWGPVQVVSDIAPPAKAQQTPGGVALWGAANPIHINRRNPSTGIRWLMQIPGDYDSRVPLPFVEFLHWSISATGATPYSDPKMTNVLAALIGAGYAVLSSDNGPATTAGGTQDKFGNQAGIDDYAALVDWFRQHFNTGPLCLLGGSQGGMFLQNILASRLQNAIGNIAAAASISGGTDANWLAATQPGFTSLIEAAFGATDLPTLAAALIAQDNDPIAQTAAELRGTPQRFYVALDDTLTPKSVHVDPVISKIGSTAPEASVVTVATGGHLAATLFQGSDLVTFFDKYAK